MRCVSGQSSLGRATSACSAISELHIKLRTAKHTPSVLGHWQVRPAAPWKAWSGFTALGSPEFFA